MLEKMSEREFISIMTVFLISESLIYGIAGQAQNDILTAIFISIAISCAIYQMYFYILKRNSGKHLFTILDNCFGKIIGRFVTLFYCLYTFCAFTAIILEFKSILFMIHLSETPQLFILVFLSYLLLYGVRKNIVTLGKSCRFFIDLIALFLLMITLLEIPTMDLDNMLPIFNTDIKLIAQGVFSAVTFPFCEVFIFMALIDYLKKTDKVNKVYYLSLLYGSLIIIVVTFSQLVIIGPDEYVSSFFPLFMSASRIIFKDLQGIEILISVSLILSVFFKMTVYLTVTTRGVAHIFNVKQYHRLTLPLIIYAVLICLIDTNGMIYYWEWISDYWSYIATPFLLIIPSILFVITLIKNRSQQTS